MIRQSLLLLISSLLLFQCSPVKSASQLPPNEDPEAYAVYVAILPSEWPLRAAKAKMLVIKTETRGYEMCLRPEKESEELISGAISQYVKLNEKSWPLQRKFDLGISYELVSDEGLKAINNKSGWEGFYKQYPESGGWIELSAVGFNADKTVAVVYMGHSCGILCGGGGFHVLQKKDGKWMPLEWKGTSCGWAS